MAIKTDHNGRVVILTSFTASDFGRVIASVLCASSKHSGNLPNAVSSTFSQLLKDIVPGGDIDAFLGEDTPLDNLPPPHHPYTYKGKPAHGDPTDGGEASAKIAAIFSISSN